MSNLFNLENKFQDYLFKANSDIFNHVVDSGKVPAEIRLGIYSNAYHSRLRDALAVSYPVLQKHIGFEEFQVLCYAYIDSHPSSFRSIRWFGDKLNIFLSENSPYKEIAYLSELAAFEWTMNLVFDAMDEEILELEYMQRIPPSFWESMQLKLHPSIHRLSLSWRIPQFWEAMNTNQPIDEPLQNSSQAEWLLWRKGLTSHFSILSEDEAWAIDALNKKNATFGELCEGLCEWIPKEQAGMHAASLLKGWILSGLITKVTLVFKEKYSC